MLSKFTEFKWKSIAGWHIIIPLLLIQLVTSKALIDPVVTIRFTVFAGYLLVFSLALLISKKMPLTFNKSLNNPVIYSYLAYCLFAAISLIYTPNFADGIFEVLKSFLAFALLILLLISITDYSNFLKKVLKTIVVLALIIVGISLYQLFKLSQSSGISHENLYAVKAVFAHKNILSEVLLLMLPFTIASVIYLRKLFRIFGSLASVLLLFFITILLTRAVWLAFAAAMLSGTVFFILFVLPKHKLNLRNKLAFAAGFIFVIVVVATSILMYSKTDTLDTFQKQTEKIVNFNYGSTKDRIILWKKTGEIIKENPIKGKGLASWKIQILKQGNTELRSEDLITFYQRPHNDFLWIWSESGIIALFAYLLIFVFAIFKAIKITRNSDFKNSILMMLMFMLLIGYLVFSFFSFPKERIEHGVFLSVCLFLILGNNVKNDEKFIKSSFKYRTILFVVFIVSLFALIVGISRMRSENNLLKAFEARNRSDWTEVVKYNAKAEVVFYKIDPFSTPISWYSGGAYFNMGYIEKAIIEYEKAANLNPYHVYVLNDLASCYNAQGETLKAISLYENAIKIAPNYQDAIFNLTAVYFNNNNLSDAYSYFTMIDSTKSNKKYQQFANVICDKIAEGLAQSIDEVILTNKIQDIRNSDEWIYKVLTNSLVSNTDFKERLIEEALYSLCEIDSIISKNDSEILKEKYITN